MEKLDFCPCRGYYTQVSCPLVVLGKGVGTGWEAGSGPDEHALEGGISDLSWTNSFSQKSVVEVWL